MSLSINETLSQGLSLLTYNGDTIVTPRDNHLNIFMGIGLWSVNHGLSKGLPIDVMQMLLSAAIMRSQIMEVNLGQSSKIIILIADSMAIREGAEKEKTSQIIQIYKKSLEPLLDLLNIKESSEIILSSELESSVSYGEVLLSVEDSPIVKRLQREDETHYAYVRTQTAITRYMNTCGDAGIKVGWICAESIEELTGKKTAQALKKWDELKFDRWCEEICEDSNMQYLYAKAGWKQSGPDTTINLREGCPYTAYPGDRCYVVHPQGKNHIKEICPIPPRLATHWQPIAEVCSNLMQARLVDCALLPEKCIKKNNAKATAYNMLNHWANPPLLPSKIIEEDPIPILSSDSSYNPTLEDSYRSLMPETCTVVLDEPKPRQTCILL